MPDLIKKVVEVSDYANNSCSFAFISPNAARTLPNTTDKYSDESERRK